MSDGMARVVGDVVPEIVLALGGVVILLVALLAGRQRQAACAWLALGVIGLAAAVTFAMLGGPTGITFFGTYARDDIAAFGRLLVLGATAVTIVFSIPWFRTDPRHGEYYVLLLYSALGAVLLTGATDLKEFVLAMLMSSATGFVLVAYHRRSSAALEAGIKYYLIGALANSAMLAGVALLFGIAGGTTLESLRTGLPGTLDAGTIVGVSLIVLGLAFKLGAAPVHTWVPDVAQGAPVPVAGFVTAVPKIGAFIFFVRFVMVLSPSAAGWPALVAVLAAVTMTIGNLACLWQDDLKRLLGWSAVSQAGYGLMGIAAVGASPLAVPSVLFFLIAYVPANLACFGAVAALRGRTALADWNGVAHERPWVAGAVAVSFLSFIGVPPLSGFVAKLLLFLVAIEAGFAWLAVIAAVNTVISIFYYVRLLAPAYFIPRETPVPQLRGLPVPLIVAVTASLLVAGIVAEPLLAGMLRMSFAG